MLISSRFNSDPNLFFSNLTSEIRVVFELYCHVVTHIAGPIRDYLREPTQNVS